MVRRYRRKSHSDSKGLVEDGTGTAVAAAHASSFPVVVVVVVVVVIVLLGRSSKPL